MIVTAADAGVSELLLAVSVLLPGWLTLKSLKTASPVPSVVRVVVPANDPPPLKLIVTETPPLDTLLPKESFS